VIDAGVSRRDVIAFYVEYDRRKKGQPSLRDLATWPWDNLEALDQKLRDNGLKAGVLPAYRSWWLVELDLSDLLDCAIVNHIFPDRPQALGLLVGQGSIETWAPPDRPEWWEPLSSGLNLPREWALILRPSVSSERPAKWYLEDGSGRALALVQRMLRSGEPWRTAFAYLGIVPDESSSFIRSRSELSGGAGAARGPAF
jgi:hypothetical protein